MSQVLNTYIFGNAISERIIKDWRILSKMTFEQLVESRLRPYYGKSLQELRSMFQLETIAKNIVENRHRIREMNNQHG